jgi:hypothetical protein
LALLDRIKKQDAGEMEPPPIAISGVTSKVPEARPFGVYEEELDEDLEEEVGGEEGEPEHDRDVSSSMQTRYDGNPAEPGDEDDENFLDDSDVRRDIHIMLSSAWFLLRSAFGAVNWQELACC